MGVDEFGRFRLVGNSVEMDVKKKKRTTAKVQIQNHEPVEVVLSQNCSSLAEHAGFLQEKINQSQGELLGLELTGPVKLTAIFVDNTALMDHDVHLDDASHYTFRFKLIDETGDDGLGQSENGPNQMEELANRMAQLAEEKNGLEKQVNEQAEAMECQQKLMKALEEKVAQMEEKQAKDQGHSENGPNQLEELANQMAQMAKEKDGLEKLVKDQAEKMTKLEEKLMDVQAKHQDQMEQFQKEKDSLEKLLEGQAETVEELRKHREGEQKIRLMPEYAYAKLIGVPNVDMRTSSSLHAKYDKEKLLLLIKHGNDITKSLYIQENQKLFNDRGLLQRIVDLLATTDKPEKMIEEVTMELENYRIECPKREGLKLKETKSNVAIKWNEASTNPVTLSGYTLAEYELANNGSLFQVFIYYYPKYDDIKEYVAKFVYRRLT